MTGFVYMRDAMMVRVQNAVQAAGLCNLNPRHMHVKLKQSIVLAEYFEDPVDQRSIWWIDRQMYASPSGTAVRVEPGICGSEERRDVRECKERCLPGVEYCPLAAIMLLWNRE